MLCEKCGKNEATNYYEYNINGQQMKLHLCSHCAQQMGLGSLGWPSAMGVPNLLFASGLAGGQGAHGAGRVCSCGATEAEIRRTGRPGCAQCYQTFQDLFLPMIRRIHGGVQHVGAAPKGAPVSPEARLDRLNAEMSQAIAKQDFERAAQLRDEIKALGEQGGQA